MWPFRVWLIEHADFYDENDRVYFGPFRFFEMKKRLNGPYADLLVQAGDLDAFKVSRKEKKKLGYINPRKLWMTEEKQYA